MRNRKVFLGVVGSLCSVFGLAVLVNRFAEKKDRGTGNPNPGVMVPAEDYNVYPEDNKNYDPESELYVYEYGPCPEDVENNKNYDPESELYVDEYGAFPEDIEDL